jgi:hypothetical protein
VSVVSNAGEGEKFPIAVVGENQINHVIGRVGWCPILLPLIVLLPMRHLAQLATR